MNAIARGAAPLDPGGAPRHVGAMVAATERKLAWIVLAILACVALIGFGQGLLHALAATPRTGAVEGGGAVVAPLGVAPRDAGAALPLDEARVHEIAREEADAAIARARPPARKARTPEPEAEDADDAAPSARPPVTDIVPPTPLATPPATPQNTPSNPDQH